MHQHFPVGRRPSRRLASHRLGPGRARRALRPGGPPPHPPPTPPPPPPAIPHPPHRHLPPPPTPPPPPPPSHPHTPHTHPHTTKTPPPPPPPTPPTPTSHHTTHPLIHHHLTQNPLSPLHTPHTTPSPHSPLPYPHILNQRTLSSLSLSTPSLFLSPLTLRLKTSPYHGDLPPQFLIQPTIQSTPPSPPSPYHTPTPLFPHNSPTFPPFPNHPNFPSQITLHLLPSQTSPQYHPQTPTILPIPTKPPTPPPPPPPSILPPSTFPSPPPTYLPLFPPPLPLPPFPSSPLPPFPPPSPFPPSFPPRRGVPAEPAGRASVSTRIRATSPLGCLPPQHVTGRHSVQANGLFSELRPGLNRQACADVSARRDRTGELRAGQSDQQA